MRHHWAQGRCPLPTRLLSQVAAPTTMKLTIAVLALLCLSSAVSASSNAADFKKLPLAHLLAGQALNAIGEANITVAGKQAGLT